MGALTRQRISTENQINYLITILMKQRRVIDHKQEVRAKENASKTVMSRATAM